MLWLFVPLTEREREEGGVEEVREGVIYYLNSIHPRLDIELKFRINDFAKSQKSREDIFFSLGGGKNYF